MNENNKDETREIYQPDDEPEYDALVCFFFIGLAPFIFLFMKIGWWLFAAVGATVIGGPMMFLSLMDFITEISERRGKRD